MTRDSLSTTWCSLRGSSGTRWASSITDLADKLMVNRLCGWLMSTLVLSEKSTSSVIGDGEWFWMTNEEQVGAS